MLNYKTNSNTNVMYNYKNSYENEGELELEGDILVERFDADLQVEDENGNNSSVFTTQEDVNERFKLASQIEHGGSEASKTTGVPLGDPNADDDFSNEMYGFGANKKV